MQGSHLRENPSWVALSPLCSPDTQMTPRLLNPSFQVVLRLPPVCGSPLPRGTAPGQWTPEAVLKFSNRAWRPSVLSPSCRPGRASVPSLGGALRSRGAAGVRLPGRPHPVLSPPRTIHPQMSRRPLPHRSGAPLLRAGQSRGRVLLRQMLGSPTPPPLRVSDSAGLGWA